LYEEATLDYVGKLKPGCNITASIVRTDVPLHIRFEIYGKATITYELAIPNMSTWQAVHAHFSSYDLRIPPYSCYIEEENRPYYPETMIIFKLKKGEEPPDTRNQPGGASGGFSREGYLLPPVITPAPEIDTKGESKVEGAKRGSPGSGDGLSDSSSDSGEDEENEETHKLHQLHQAAIKELILTVEIKAEYDWGLRKFEAIFFKSSKNTRRIEDLFAPMMTAYAELEVVGRTFQGGLPFSCMMLDLPRDQVEVSVIKVGEGIHLRYGRKDSMAVEIDDMPDQVQVQLIRGWNVSFGADDNAKDGELTQRLLYITYQQHEITKMFFNPWQIRLEGMFMRAGEKGQRVAGFCALGNGWDDERQLPPVPYCAKSIPTHYDAARGKETNALLHFGFHNHWPLSVSVVFPISPVNTLQITYEVS
jgi:hypothetical protein